jgi:hypothetical protein
MGGVWLRSMLKIGCKRVWSSRKGSVHVDKVVKGYYVMSVPLKRLKAMDKLSVRSWHLESSGDFVWLVLDATV